MCIDCPADTEAEGNECKCTAVDGAVLENDVCKCPDGRLVLNGACVSREHFICNEDVAIDCEGVCGGSLCSNKLTNQVDFTGDTLGSLDDQGSIKIAVSPDGNHLYAVSSKATVIVYWNLDTSGTLTNKVESGNLVSGASVAVSPDGEFVYVADLGGDELIYFQRNKTTGALSNQQSVDLSAPTNLKVSLDSKRIYAVDINEGFHIISRDIETDVHTKQNTVNYKGSQNVVESPDGNYLFLVTGGVQLHRLVAPVPWYIRVGWDRIHTR